MQIDLDHWKGHLDQELTCRIERRILGVLGSTSGLLLPEFRPISRFERLQLAFKIAAAPAVARSLRLRLEYVFSFFGFSVHLLLKDHLRRLLASARIDG